MNTIRNMNNTDMEMHLRRAAEAMNPDGGREMAEKLWDVPVEKATGTEWFLDGTCSEVKAASGKPAKGSAIRISQVKVRRWALSIAACLVAGLAVFYHMSLSTYATVYLDINPSFSIDINRREKVLDAAADNADGAAILKSLQLKNMEIESAVALILEAAADRGYIRENENAVLLSVGSSNADTGELRSRLSGEVERKMSEASVAGTVYEQDIDEDDLDDEVEELAEKYGMSPAKALLLETLVRDNPELGYEELAELSVRELQQRLKDGGSDLRDYTLWRGMDPDDYEEAFEDDPEAPGHGGDDHDEIFEADDEDDREETAEDDYEDDEPDEPDSDDDDRDERPAVNNGPESRHVTDDIHDVPDSDDTADDAYEKEDHDADDDDRDTDSRDPDDDDGDTDADDDD